MKRFAYIVVAALALVWSVAAAAPAQAQMGGAGMVISMRQGWLTVIQVLPGSPAAQAGVHEYDRIVRIGNQSTHGFGLEQAVALIRGAPGTVVEIVVRRMKPNGGYSGATRRLRITRAPLPA
jgi:C-terminal processing protease CtpA/Prc